MSNEKFDVCIVGGGVMGLCCAHHLSRKGLKVSLVERGDRVTPEASQNNGGMGLPFEQMLD